MLEHVTLFSQIPADSLARLESTSSTRRCARNTILWMEGDTNSHLYVIQTGLVSVYTDDEEGRQLVLNYMGPGECFGELALIDEQPRSASVVTVEDSVFLCISRDSFRAFLREHPELYEVLMVQLTRKIRQLTDNVKDMALLGVYGRVASTLERLCGSAETSDLRLTHQDIANMVGASREMVSRVMKELVVGGYVEVHQKHIRILRRFPKNW